MKKDKISQLFGSLQQLEKCTAGSRKLLSKRRSQSAFVTLMVRQQESILARMRRTANKLQLEYASEDWQSFYRNLSIFHGLQVMVQPEVLQTYSDLSNKQLHTRLTESESKNH